MPAKDPQDSAYNELEGLSDEQFAKYGVELIADLPRSVRLSLYAQQDEILAKYGLTEEDFMDPHGNRTTFIAAD